MHIHSHGFLGILGGQKRWPRGHGGLKVGGNRVGGSGDVSTSDFRRGAAVNLGSSKIVITA